ncbi:Integrator complex subunit 7 [Gigaspora margarita]|uniref:Integrator complex subunit 7 n=1 Tax=Gigaspora margarita TaxID=4874 RepID=A0A8H3XBX8_GIGMA|nr:Integrator complex subunit 7 [Gigaspora margarita]
MQEYITTNNDDIFAEVSKFILMVSKLRKSIIQILKQNLIAVLKSSELLSMPRSFTLLAKTALEVPPKVNTEAESFQQMIIATIQSFGQIDESTICNNHRKEMDMKVGLDQMFDLQPEQADILDTFEDSIRHYAQDDEGLNGFMALMDISNQRLFAKYFTFFELSFLRP